MKIKMDFRVITVDQFRKRREFRHLFRIFQRHLRQLPERAAIAGVEIDAGGMGFVEKEPFRIHHRHNQQQMLFQYPGRLRIVAGEKFDQPEGAGGTGFFGTAVKAGDQHDIFFIVRYRGVGRADEKQRITGVIFGKSFDLQVRRPFFIIAQQRFKLLRFQPGMVADIPPVGIVFQFGGRLSPGFFHGFGCSARFHLIEQLPARGGVDEIDDAFLVPGSVTVGDQIFRVGLEKAALPGVGGAAVG